MQQSQFIDLQKEMYPGGKICELPNLSTTQLWARATSCKNLLSRFQCVIQQLCNVLFTDKWVHMQQLREDCYVS